MTMPCIKSCFTIRSNQMTYPIKKFFSLTKRTSKSSVNCMSGIFPWLLFLQETMLPFGSRPQTVIFWTDPTDPFQKSLFFNWKANPSIIKKYLPDLRVCTQRWKNWWGNWTSSRSKTQICLKHRSSPRWKPFAKMRPTIYFFLDRWKLFQQR